MTDLERFTDGVARRMAGQPEPERDEVPFDGDDPRYRAALLAEQRADVDDEDDEELEAEDFDPAALGNYALGASLAMGFGQATDEEIAEAKPLELDDESEAAPDEGLPLRAAEWWDSLDPVAQSRVLEGTPEQAAAAHGLWLARNPDGARGADTTSGYEIEGPMPRTGAEFVAWAEANADGIAEQFDMTPDQYVAAMARASAAEWRKIANASGIPFEAKPSYNQLSAKGQMELIKADLAASAERTIERGGHW